MAGKRKGPETPRDVVAHYEQVSEAGRLDRGPGLLERARSREIIGRYLPDRQAAILDVGGGTGDYALWLAGLGHRVTLVDPVASQVEEARRVSAARGDAGLDGAAVGDARSLAAGDASADLVLLMGPLYHLLERSERVAALAEARRVLRPGGRVIAAAISRFASTLDGLVRHLLDDPRFEAIVLGDLADGRHRNTTGDPRYFTTAYFHRPEELAGEMEAAGLRHEATLAVEGPAWMLHDLDARWESEERRERLVAAIRRVEAEPTLLGASAHVLAVGVA